MTTCMAVSLLVPGQPDRAGPACWPADGDRPSWAARDGSAVVSLPWGTMMLAASAGVMAGYSALMTAMASAPPMICAPMKLSTELGAIPAKVSENIRPTVMAGLAKLVEDVNQYAAPI